MILLRVTCHTEEARLKIAETLLKEKMVIDVNFKNNIQRIELQSNGQFTRRDIFLFTAKTKALLFSHIEKLLKEQFNNEYSDLHSLAIVQMDWLKAEALVQEVKKV